METKIALHDEFSDENLESSVYNVEYDFKKKSVRSGSITEKRTTKFFTLESDPNNYLQKSLKELQSLQ